MNKIVCFFLIFLLIAIGCSEPKPRMPISYNSGYDQSASIAYNKKLYEQEFSMINRYMKRDSLVEYVDSKHGFWYAYKSENINDTIFPKKGDLAIISYHIQDFNKKELYSESEIGTKKYKVDQEEMIQGLQEGIKWMNKGEKVIFLLPSHKAYAYHGDENKIGPNTPIIVTLTLNDILNAN